MAADPKPDPPKPIENAECEQRLNELARLLFRGAQRVIERQRQADSARADESTPSEQM